MPRPDVLLSGATRGALSGTPDAFAFYAECTLMAGRENPSRAGGDFQLTATIYECSLVEVAVPDGCRLDETRNNLRQKCVHPPAPRRRVLLSSRMDALVDPSCAQA